MKTKQFLRMAVCCLLTMTGSWSAKAIMNQEEDGYTISIHKVLSDPQGAPRDMVPFFAEYNETLSAVMLGCNDSIGDVTVTLESTAGDWYRKSMLATPARPHISMRFRSIPSDS